MYNFKYLMQHQVNKQKCAKQKVRKYDKLRIFKKPLTRKFQICKNICKIFKN